MPPMAGPATRLALTIEELSAIALGRSARSSIMVTTNACRAGVSKALMTPWKTWSAEDLADGDDAGEGEDRERQRLY